MPEKGVSMKKLLMRSFLLFLALGLGLPGCGPNFLKSDKKASQKAKKERRSKRNMPDELVEEFELADEMDDDFFDQESTGSVDYSDDFAWADDDNVVLRPVHFDFDKDAIRSDQEPALERALMHAKDVTRKGNIFVVEGHADAIGKNRIYNLDLSERRARAVAKHINSKGVPKKRIKVVGRGQEMLKAVTDHTPDAQAPNRRVEFYSIKL